MANFTEFILSNLYKFFVSMASKWVTHNFAQHLLFVVVRRNIFFNKPVISILDEIIY